MFVLDTDSISHDQKAHPILKKRVNDTPRSQLFTTSITVEEQLKGRLAFINRHRNSPGKFSLGHEYLIETISYLQKWNILVYDESAGIVFARLSQHRIRIGKQDLRIAAITLIHGHTLVTSNRRDFIQVPNLKIVDWTMPVSNGEPR
jgi:tRNA(fMet)-specific endonuclease VapC